MKDLPLLFPLLFLLLFLGEDQFESYRSLGYDITRSAFDRVMQPDCLVDPKPDMIDCAKKLKNMFSPILPNIG